MTIVPVTELSTYLRRPDAPPRVSASDGEWYRCPSCFRIGYGVDSWQPMTTEYFASHHGRLILSQCKACRSDFARHKRGMVSGCEGRAAA